MSSRCLRAASAPLILLALAACHREDRGLHNPPLAATAPGVEVTELRPGGLPPPPPDPQGRQYEGNAYAINQGGELFKNFNCNGCHFNGGGGIGPPLMDDQWRYGGSIDQIYASIAQGRPNGMPAWGRMIPSQQIWQLAAYVRSLSGNQPSSAESSRQEALNSISPRNQTHPETPKLSNPASTQVPAP